jgi:hypothetical protein
MVNIQLPKRKRIKKASKLWALPWDEKKVTKTQTVEEMKTVAKMFAAASKAKKKPNPGVNKMQQSRLNKNRSNINR